MLRRHLRSLAADLWPMTVPMALTLLRVGLLPVFLTLLVTRHRVAALVVFGVMVVSDNLDGRLARRWGQTSRLGTLLDPAADKLLVNLSLVLLAFPRFAPARFAIPWPVVAGAYLKDLGVLIGIGVVIAKAGRVQIAAKEPGKISTTAQLALVIATLLAPEWVRASPTFAGTFLWCLWYATVFAAAAAGVAYSVEGARQLTVARASRP